MTMFSDRYCWFIIVLFAISLQPCFGHKKNVTHWKAAGITWYGDREGPGSTGGACGFGDAVGKPPYSCMVSAGGPSIYKDGKGCGACYKMFCKHQFCTGKPIKVMISDECPGCTKSAVHFDLSGKAFGLLAKPGKCDQLRNLGELQVKYRRVCCKNHNTKLAVHIDPGANPYYMSFSVKFANGDGNFDCIHIQEVTGKWWKMEPMRSAVWKLNPGCPLKGPFNVKLTSGVKKHVLIAKKVIPAHWKPGAIYHSRINFADNFEYSIHQAF